MKIPLNANVEDLKNRIGFGSILDYTHTRTVAKRYGSLLVEQTLMRDDEVNDAGGGV